MAPRGGVSAQDDRLHSKAGILSHVLTWLLNAFYEDSYLVKEFQNGKSPVILGIEYDEDRDDYEISPYGYTGRLREVVDQVLDR